MAKEVNRYFVEIRAGENLSQESLIQLKVLLRDFVPGEMLSQFARTGADPRAQIGCGNGAMDRVCECVGIIRRNQKTVDAVNKWRQCVASD